MHGNSYSTVAVALNPAFFLVALAQPLLSWSNLSTSHDSSLGQLKASAASAALNELRKWHMANRSTVDIG